MTIGSRPLRLPLVVALLTVAAVTVALALTFGRRAPTGAPSVEPPSARAKDEPAATVEAPAAAGRAVATTLEAPETPSLASDAALLRGRVVDEDARAIAGATIAVHHRPGEGISSLDAKNAPREVRVGECTSGEDGRFALAAPPDVPLRVDARAEGHASALLTNVYAGADVEIVLGPAVTLMGRITRALDGSPVESATVRVFRRGGPVHAQERSSPDGSYRIAGLPPGAATIEVHSDWLADPPWTTIELPAGARCVHDVELAEGVAVHGTVRDARTGTPIAGAEIGAGWWYSRAVRTDTDGRYELRGFGGSGVQEIFVRARGYADAVHEFAWARMPDERTQLDFALDPGRRAHGRVVDPEARPVEGVYVAAVSDGPTMDWKSARTDADGRFFLDSLHPLRQHALLVRAEGWASLVYAFPMDEREHEDLDVGTITLQRACTMAGAVIDDAGRPVPDVEVSLRGENRDAGKLLGGVPSPHLPERLRSRAMRTDATGAFRFSGLAGGDYRPSVARRTGMPVQQPSIALAEGERRTGVQLVLPSAAVLRGRVETADGEPAVGAQVQAIAEAFPEDRTPYLRARCGDGGTFVIEGVGEDSYTLYVERHWLEERHARDHAFTRVSGVRAGGDEVVIVLASAVPLEGRVVAASGEPAEGAFVHATLDGSYLDSDYCDEHGRFRVLVPTGAVCDLTVRPTKRSEDGAGWTILSRGIDFMNVPAGTLEHDLLLPLR